MVICILPCYFLGLLELGNPVILSFIHIGKTRAASLIYIPPKKSKIQNKQNYEHENIKLTWFLHLLEFIYRT